MITAVKSDVKSQRSKTSPQVLYRPVEEFRNKGVLREYYRGTLTYQKVREMRRDPTIAMVRQLIVAPALMAPWNYKPQEGMPDGADEFIKKQLDHLRGFLVRTTLFGCIDYGWQSFEKIFGVKDGKTIITRMKPLLPDFTDILIESKTGGFRGLRERNMWYGNYNYIPVNKSFVHAFDVEGTYWYGQSYMANAEDAYDQWTTANDANVRYDAKIAGSHWVVHYPMGESVYNGERRDNQDIAMDILGALESSGGIALPKKIEEFITELDKETPNAWEVELLSDKGATQTNFLERMAYLDKLKVRAFGFPERSILEGKYGTKAEAETHADFAVTNILLRTNDLLRDLNLHLVDQILALNYGADKRGTVRIVSGSIGSDNRAFLRDVYMKLLGDSRGFLNEVTKMDLQTLRDVLFVPTDLDSEDDETELFEKELEKLEEKADQPPQEFGNGLFNEAGPDQLVRDGERGEMGRPGQFRRSAGDIGSNNMGDNTSGSEDRRPPKGQSVQNTASNVVTNNR